MKYLIIMKMEIKSTPIYNKIIIIIKLIINL